jgi:alpha-1,2-glucosyltransferase
MKKFLPIILALLILATAFILIKDKSHYADELEHHDQIALFAKGNFKLTGHTATLPLYYALLAIPAAILQDTSYSFLRSLNLLLSLLSILVFYFLAKKTSSNPEQRTLQYLLFPILFIFFFLLYTDVLSLLLILLATLLVLNNRPLISSIPAILAILTRQNNIIWLLFLIALSYFQGNNTISIEKVKSTFKKTWPYALAIIAFLAFAILNKGIAIGDKAAHPLKISSGNIFFLLFLFFFLFLPLIIVNLPAVLSQIKNRTVFLLLIIAFFLYITTFSPSHPYNHGSYFLRNPILAFMIYSQTIKLLCFIPIALSLLALSAIPLKEKRYYLIYPATILFLIPSWLIEPRYYLIPFILFLVSRKEQKPIIENLTILYYLIISAGLYFLVYNNKCFL